MDGPRRDLEQLAGEVMTAGAGDPDSANEPLVTGLPSTRIEVDQLVLAGPAGDQGRVPSRWPFHHHLLDPADPVTVAGQRRPLHHHPEPFEALGHHLGGHEPSAMAAALVPGRGEKMKVYALS